MSTFEDALLKSITDQFFTSHLSSTQQDGNGNITTYYTPNPALRLAQQLFDSKKEIIMAMVMEKLDLDLIAYKLSKSVTEALTTDAPAQTWGHDPHRALRDQIQKAIIEKVASDMAEEVKRKMTETNTEGAFAKEKEANRETI